MCPAFPGPAVIQLPGEGGAGCFAFGVWWLGALQSISRVPKMPQQLLLWLIRAIDCGARLGSVWCHRKDR